MDEQAEATARAYDSAALDFADRTGERSALASEFFDLFLDTLEPGSRVGDLGCGPGHDLRRLLSAGNNRTPSQPAVPSAQPNSSGKEDRHAAVQRLLLGE